MREEYQAWLVQQGSAALRQDITSQEPGLDTLDDIMEHVRDSGLPASYAETRRGGRT